MRDLLFKNITSENKKRKVIASCEIVDSQELSCVTQRHFIWIIKEARRIQAQKPLPYLYVLKEHNTLEKKEKFFCRLKGSIYTVSQGKLFLILFAHSLKITITEHADN